MSERIYGVALDDSRPLPDGKHCECWVSVGGVVTQDAGLRAIVDAQHSALVARGEAVPAPLSQRIKPGDVLENKYGTRVRIKRVDAERYWFQWMEQVAAYPNHEVAGHPAALADASVWRLVEPAPSGAVAADDAERLRDFLAAENERANAADRRHNAHCPHCYGPAYQGLGALRCEREGGCLAEREPGPTEVGEDTTFVSLATDRGEKAWWVYGHAVIRRAQYATRELAVAAWRSAVIAKAKREAGL